MHNYNSNHCRVFKQMIGEINFIWIKLLPNLIVNNGDQSVYYLCYWQCYLTCQFWCMVLIRIIVWLSEEVHTFNFTKLLLKSSNDKVMSILLILFYIFSNICKFQKCKPLLDSPVILGSMHIRSCPCNWMLCENPPYSHANYGPFLGL